MVRVDRIGEDALARVESGGAFGGKRLIWFATGARPGFGSFHVHQREISDGTGPGEFGVPEGGIVVRGRGEAWGRHHDEYDVPQGSGYQGATREFALAYPAFL